jgi:CubicO group peptidase (beta-lactamase class C family)
MQKILAGIVFFLILQACKHPPMDSKAPENEQAVQPGFSWQVYKNPVEAGFSADALENIKAYFDNSRLSALFVVYRDHVVLALGEYDRRFQCHSIRKSLMNAVVGSGFDEHIIHLDNTLEDLGIDDLRGLTKKEKQAKLRHLLQSRSGVYHPAVYETPSMADQRPERNSKEPGGFWYYNNWDFNVLSSLVEQEMGDDFWHLFSERIARPLDMEDYRELDAYYYIDSTVSFHKAYACKLSARDLARFGLLYLHKGVWNGKRILSEEWIRVSTIPYSQTNTSRGGYGYLWWIPTLADSIQAFAACGVGTQVLLVIPQLELIIVQRVNTYTGNTHPFDRCLYEMIVKAKVLPAQDSHLLGPLPSTGKEMTYRIRARSDFAGKYEGMDGVYNVREYGEGLMIEYPKGMKSLLISGYGRDTFLVDDVLEIIGLKKLPSSTTGTLTVLGSMK